MESLFETWSGEESQEYGAAHQGPDRGVATQPRSALLRATPPRHRKDFLHRKRFDQSFLDWAEIPVVAIQASSGYGKTVLLDQWRRDALFKGAATAWLSLSRQDTPAHILDGLAVSLALATGVGPDQVAARKEITSLSDALAEAMRLVDLWLSFTKDLYLFLDNADSLEDDGSIRLLEYLIDNMPPNGRLFLAVKSTSAIPRAIEYQSYGKLIVLPEASLAFDIEEASAFFLARLGQRLVVETMMQLHEYSRGWPMALELMCATLRSSADERRQIELLKTGDRVVTAPVLDRLSVEAGRKLMDLASLCPGGRNLIPLLHMVGRLNFNLCDSLFDADEVGILRDLRKGTTLFIDHGDGDWFQLNPFVRAYLDTLETTSSAPRKSQISSRAADWLIRHGQFEEAVSHALRAGEQDLAVSAMQNCLAELVGSGRLDVIRGWLAQIERSKIASCGTLAASLACYEIMDGDDAVEPSCGLTGRKGRFVAEILAAIGAYRRDEPDEALAILSRWPEPPPGVDDMMLRIFANLSEWLKQYGIQRLWQPREQSGRRLGFGKVSNAEGASLHCWAVGHLANGRPAAVEKRARPALVHFESHEGRRSLAAFMTAISLAAVASENDEFAEVRRLLADRMDLIRLTPSPEALSMGYFAASALAESEGRKWEALDLLNELLELTRSRGLLRGEIAAVSEIARLQLSSGEDCSALEKYKETASRLNRLYNPAGLNAGRIEALTHLTEARTAWIRNGSAASVETCKNLIKLTHGHRLVRLECEARLLWLTALAVSNGEIPRKFDETVALLRARGLNRIVRNHLELLPAGLRPRAGEPVAVPALGPELADEPFVSPAHPEPRHPVGFLTAREAVIVSLLDKRLSNKEIARRMEITPGTVKWHLKNLSSKFHAMDRQDVVSKAKIFGFLDSSIN